MFRAFVSFTLFLAVLVLLRNGPRRSPPALPQIPDIEATVSQNPQDVIWEPLQESDELPPWRRG